MKYWNGMVVSLPVLALSAAAFAQGATPTITNIGTCPTTLTGLTTLNLERVVTLNNVLTTLTPNVPANILASISGGGQEVRERLFFNTQTATVTSTIFLVAPGSPNPTPLSMDIAGQTLQTSTLNVDEIRASCTPTPSLLLVGTVGTVTPGPALRTGGSLTAAFNLAGAPGAISIGYTTDNPPKVNNVVFVVAGQALIYSPAATGTVSFTGVPVTPPGTSAAGPHAVITLPGGMNVTSSMTAPLQVTQSPLTLSATSSTGTGLTYTWVSTPPVALGTPTAGTLMIQFPQAGDYRIMLTVTDSSGATNTISIVLQYTGRPQ